MVYVPTYQGLGARELLRPRQPAPAFPFDEAHHLRFYRARNAIYFLFETLVATRGSVKVLAPDYNSGNEMLAMRAAGAAVSFYPVTREGGIDLAALEAQCNRESPDLLYLIHYLGWPQPMRQLLDLCERRGMLMVEDCALALLSHHDGRPLGSFGDWSVFCLYKTLPVPNGAVLVQNHRRLARLERLPRRRAAMVSVAGRTAELIAQRVRSRCNGVGAALLAAKRVIGRASDGAPRTPVGDLGFDLGDVDLAMSALSSRLVASFDFDRIRTRRARNFRDIVGQINGAASFLYRDLPEGACPLFVPMLVDDKAAAAARLQRSGIQALEFWNVGANGARSNEGPGATFLRDRVLGLPVHQDLTPRQIDHLVRHAAAVGQRSAL